MKYQVFNTKEEKYIFESIQLVNDLMFEKGFIYCPYFFKDNYYKNEYSLAIVKMDFKNVINTNIPIGSLVKGNKTDMNIVLKSLAKFINTETVNNFDITKPNKTLISNKQQFMLLVDNILRH